MRALEKFPRVWNATSRSGRIWKLEANKARVGPGELFPVAPRPLLVVWMVCGRHGGVAERGCMSSTQLKLHRKLWLG